MKRALCLILLGLLWAGCLETDQLQEPPEAACEDVESALNSATAFDPSKLQVGDFVHTEATLAPLTNNPQVVNDVLQELIAVNPQGDGTYETRYLQTTTTYQNGQATTDTTEGLGGAPEGFGLCPSPSNVSYHGLQVFHRKEAVTDYAESCGSYTNCQIDITEIRVDQVVKDSDGTQGVRKYDFILSKDVPYVAKDLSTCMTGTIEVNGQQVPVSQCVIVRNFGRQP
jgi:hypothetical protein